MEARIVSLSHYSNTLTGVRQHESESNSKSRINMKKKKVVSFHLYRIQYSVFILNVVSVFKAHTHSSRRMDCSHNTRDVLPFCSYCYCYYLVLCCWWCCSKANRSPNVFVNWAMYTGIWIVCLAAFMHHSMRSKHIQHSTQHTTERWKL